MFKVLFKIIIFIIQFMAYLALGFILTTAWQIYK